MNTSDILTHIYTTIQNNNLPFFTSLIDCFTIEYEVFFEIHEKGLILTIFKEDNIILSDNIIYTINNLQQLPDNFNNFITESEIKINYIDQKQEEGQQPETELDYIEVLQQPIINIDNDDNIDNLDKLNSLSNSYLDLLSINNTDTFRHRKILDSCEMISQQLDMIHSNLFNDSLLERSCQNDYYFNNFISPIVIDTKNVYIDDIKTEDDDENHNRLVYNNLGLSNKKTDPNGIYQLKELLFCYSSSYAHRKQSQFQCQTFNCPPFFSDINKENWYGTHQKSVIDLDFNPNYHKYNLDKNGLMISCNKHDALLINGGNIMTNINYTDPINIPGINNAYENHKYFNNQVAIYDNIYQIIKHTNNDYWDKVNTTFSYYVPPLRINSSTSVISYSDPDVPLQTISNIILDKEGHNYQIDDYQVRNQFNINNYNIRYAYGPKYLLIDNVVDDPIKGKICDGSNNKVDILYKNKSLKDNPNKKDLWIPPNKQFTNKINKPPSKIKYLDGEKLNMIGYLWHSTNNNSYNWYKSYYTNIISSIGECTVIEPICNNSLDIFDIIKSNKLKETEYVTFNNENTFKLHKNTLFLFNLINTNKSQLTLQQKTYFINKIIPSLSDVLDIYHNDFSLCGSIYDINKILLKVGLRLEDGDPFIKHQLIKTIYKSFQKYGDLIINISRLEKKNSYELLIKNTNLDQFNTNLLHYFKHININNDWSLLEIIKHITDSIKNYLETNTIHFILNYLQYLNLLDSQNQIIKNSNIFLINSVTLLSKILNIKDNIYQVFQNIQINRDKLDIIDLTSETEARQKLSCFISCYFYYSYLTSNYDISLNNYFIFNNQDIIFQDILSNYTQNITSLLQSGIKKYNMPLYYKYIVKLQLILNNTEDSGDLIKTYFLQKYIKDIYQFTHNCFNLDDLNEELTSVIGLYKTQKKLSNIEDDTCYQNIIKKKYYNKQDLIDDNYREVYSENTLDDITDDLNIFIKVLIKQSDKEKEEELTTLFTEQLQEKYFMLNQEFINKRVSHIISIYKNFNSMKYYIGYYGNDYNKCRIGNDNDEDFKDIETLNTFWKILEKYSTFSFKLAKNINKYQLGIPIRNGDYALLYSNYKQQLYKRIHDIWIKQPNNQIITDTSLCQIINTDCNNINNLCVDTNNKQIANKLNNLKIKIKQLQEKITLLTDLQQKYSNIDNIIQNKVKTLQQNIRFDKLINIKKTSYRNNLLNNCKQTVDVIANNIPQVYSDALYHILKMSNEFNRLNQLNRFINKYGLVSSKDKNIYWKLPNIKQEVLCCQHYLDLIDINSYYGDIKSKKKEEFLLKWNNSLNEKYYICKNCHVILSEKQLKDAPIFNEANKVDTNIEASESISDQIAENLNNKEQVLYQTKLIHYLNNIHITPDITVPNIRNIIDKIINLDNETRISFSDYVSNLNSLSTQSLIFNPREDNGLIKHVIQKYFNNLNLKTERYLKFEKGKPTKVIINDKILSKFKNSALKKFLEVNALTLTELPDKINQNNYQDFFKKNLSKNNIYQNFKQLEENTAAYSENLSDLEKYQNLITTCLQINLLINNYRLNNYYKSSINSLTIICCYLFSCNNNIQVNFLHSKDSGIVNIWSNYFKDSHNLIQKIDNQFQIQINDFSESQIQFVKNIATHFSSYSEIKKSILSDKINKQLLNTLFPTLEAKKKLHNNTIIAVNIFHKLLTEINSSYYKQKIKAKCIKDIEKQLLITQTESLYWRHFLPNLLPLQFDLINDSGSDLSISDKIIFYLNYQVNHINNIIKIKSNKENVYSGLLTQITDINLYKNNTLLANLIIQSNSISNNNKLLYNIDTEFTHNPIKKIRNLSYHYPSNIDYKSRIIDLYTKYCFTVEHLGKKRIFHKIYFPIFNNYEDFYHKYITNKSETIAQLKDEINAFIINKIQINQIDLFSDLTITNNLNNLVKQVLKNNGYLLYDIIENQFQITIKDSIKNGLTHDKEINKQLLDNIDIILNQKNTIINSKKAIVVYYNNNNYLTIYQNIYLIFIETIKKYGTKYANTDNILQDNLKIFSDILNQLKNLLKTKSPLETFNSQIDPLLLDTIDAQQSIFMSYSKTLLDKLTFINKDITHLFNILIDRQNSIKQNKLSDYTSQLVNYESLDKIIEEKFISNNIKYLLDILKLLDINFDTNSLLLYIGEISNDSIKLTQLNTYYKIIYFIVMLNLNLVIYNNITPSNEELSRVENILLTKTKCLLNPTSENELLNRSDKVNTDILSSIIFKKKILEITDLDIQNFETEQSLKRQNKNKKRVSDLDDDLQIAQRVFREFGIGNLFNSYIDDGNITLDGDGNVEGNVEGDENVEDTYEEDSELVLGPGDNDT